MRPHRMNRQLQPTGKSLLRLWQIGRLSPVQCPGSHSDGFLYFSSGLCCCKHLLLGWIQVTTQDDMTDYSGMFFTLEIIVADSSSLPNRALMFAFATSPFIINVWT